MIVKSLVSLLCVGLTLSKGLENVEPLIIPVELHPMLVTTVDAQPNLDGLNKVISQLTFTIPDIPISQTGFSGTISGLTCGNIQFNALDINSNRQSDQATLINLIAGVSSISCEATLSYRALSIFSGTNKFQADIGSSGIVAGLLFNSNPNYYSAPPSSLSVASCTLNANINKITISGGSSLLDSLLNLLINTLKSVLTSTLSSVGCSAFKTAASGSISTELQSLNAMLAPYLGPTPPGLSTAVTEASLEKNESNGGKLINLSGGAAIDIAASVLNEVLGAPVAPCDNNAPPSKTSMLNDILSSLNDPTGWLTIPLGFQLNNYDVLTTSNVTFKSVSIFGINSISKFSVINPVPNSKYSMTHSIRIDQLKFIFPLHIVLNPGGFTQGSKVGQIVEDIVVTMELDGLELDIGTAIGIDDSTLFDIVIENILNDPLNCISPVLKGLILSDLRVSLGDIGGPLLSGFICPGLDAFINHAIDAAFLLLKPLLLKSLPTITQQLRDMANSQVANILSVPHVCPVHMEKLTDNDFINFHNPNLTTVLNLVGGILNSGCGSSLNKIINLALTDLNIADENGKILISNGTDLLNLNLMTQIGAIKVRISDLFLANVNELYNVKLLSTASNQYATKNQLGFGKSPYFTLSVNMSLDIAEVIQDDFVLSVQLGGLEFGGDVMLMINQDILMPYSINNLLEPGCLASMLYDFNLENGNLNMGVLSPDIVCNNCKSPMFPMLTTTMKSPKGKVAIMKLVNMALDFGKAISPAVKVLGEGLIGDYSGSCSANTRVNQVIGTYVDPVITTVWTPEGLAVVGAMIGFFVVSMLFYIWWQLSTRRKFLREKEILAMQGESMDDEFNTYPLNNDPNTPNCYKMVLPLMFTCGIGIFISAHSFVGATVDLTLKVGGDTLQANNLFTFSLNNSIHDMLASGAWPLAMLIAVFSGAWPYIKILLMAFCFYSVGYIVSPAWRGRVLFFLDVMGKWSLLDVFVLVMMMAAFRLHIAAPQNDSAAFLPEKFVLADVIVNPNWGIFGFVIAATFSIVGNFLLVRLHRNSTSLNRKQAKFRESFSETGEEKKVEEDKFSVSEFIISDSYGYVQYTTLGKYLVAGLLLLSLFGFIYGSLIPSFRFTFQGAIALLLDWDSSSVKNYSLFSIASNLTGQAGPGIASWIGIIFLQFTFLAVALFVPVARVIVMLILWLVPLPLQHQHNMQEASEFFHSWSCLEVFLLSVIAAMFEVMQIATFMLNGGCDEINLILQETAVASGAILPENGTCFYVKTELTYNIFFLFMASIIGTIVGRIVTDSTERVLSERFRYEIEIEDKVGAGNKNFSFKMLQWTGIIRVEQSNSQATAFQKHRRYTYSTEVKRRRTRSRAQSAALDIGLAVEKRKSLSLSTDASVLSSLTEPLSPKKKAAAVPGKSENRDEIKARIGGWKSPNKKDTKAKKDGGLGGLTEKLNPLSESVDKDEEEEK